MASPGGPVQAAQSPRRPRGVPLAAIVDYFHLEVLTAAGLDLRTRLVTRASVNRPGTQWSDLAEDFPRRRIQLFGARELAYLGRMMPADREARLREFAALDVPAVIIAQGQPISRRAIQLAEEASIPVLRTAMSSRDFAGDLNWFLQLELAPRVVLHAGLVEVTGEGVLILGRSGIGKTETALELVRRGHRLIADDTVEVRRPTEHDLIGRAPGRMRHFMELKGIGIVNIRLMYGIGAVKSSGDIGMVVSLVPEDPGLDVGAEPGQYDLLGVDLPLITIPLRPGRNAAILIEAAATGRRARRLAGASGHDSRFEYRAETFGRLR